VSKRWEVQMGCGAYHVMCGLESFDFPFSDEDLAKRIVDTLNDYEDRVRELEANNRRMTLSEQVLVSTLRIAREQRRLKDALLRRLRPGIVELRQVYNEWNEGDAFDLCDKWLADIDKETEEAQICPECRGAGCDKNDVRCWNCNGHGEIDEETSD